VTDTEHAKNGGALAHGETILNPEGHASKRSSILDSTKLWEGQTFILELGASVVEQHTDIFSATAESKVLKSHVKFFILFISI